MNTNTGQISISKAASDDVPGIQEVFYQGWLSTYPNEEHGITVDDILDRNRDSRSPARIEKQKQVLANLSENELFLVAKDGDAVVGLCFAVRKEDRNVIQALYVLPERQGQGVGTLLWQEAKKFFDPLKRTTVLVATYNLKAIRFYQKLGFADTGTRLAQERLRMKSGSVIPEQEMALGHI